MNITTLEIWPVNAKRILEEKGIDIQNLETKFENIYFPWDIKYEQNNIYFSSRIQQHPLFIIKAIDEDEIIFLLNYIKVKNLTFRICNGRHSTQLLNPDVLLDMSLFTYKKIENDILIAGSGNTQGQLNDFLFHECNINAYSHFGKFLHSKNKENNDAFAGGSASTVGSGSISTIGGIGTLKRTFGLTIDCVLQYTIILPPKEGKSAKKVKVNKGNLFWALKGGGANNFGVITEVHYKILYVNNVVNYFIPFTNENVKNILSYWKTNSLLRPNNFNEEFNLVYNNYSISGFYVLNENETYQQAVVAINKEFKSYGKVEVGNEVQYKNLYKNLVHDREYKNFSIIQTIFINNFSSTELVNISKKLLPSINLTLELLGGKIKENSGGCFYPRQYNFFCDLSAKWNDVQFSQQNENVLNVILKKICKHEIKPIFYVGFPVTFKNIKNYSYYGDNFNKLKQISNYVDPYKIMSYAGTLNNKK